MKYIEILYKENSEKSRMSEVSMALLLRLCFNLTFNQNHVLSLFTSFLSCKKTGKTKEPILRSQLDGWGDRAGRPFRPISCFPNFMHASFVYS